MNQNNLEEANIQIHSDDIHDIISTPPRWLVRWGITIFSGVLFLILALSAFIHYPDTIKTSLQINSDRSPKPIVTKISAKVIKILVNDNDKVMKDQTLAYLESVAEPQQVMKLLSDCKQIEKNFFKRNYLDSSFLAPPINFQLGELQEVYQNFYITFLTYRASINNGLYLKKRINLQKDLQYIEARKAELQHQKKIQERDLSLAEEEYNIHKTLTDRKVETRMELKQQESRFIGKKSPIIQTEAALITEKNNFSNKLQDIDELDIKILEEKEKFLQSLNSLISNIETWKSKYIITASETGKISFIGILQENEFVNVNQQIFYIDSGNQNFFGHINIPQNNMGKIKIGQEVLIKLRGYPYEEYGIIIGKISTISDIPLRDSVFVSKVIFDSKSFSYLKKKVQLKYGMTAEAEIITENASILGRVLRNVIKIFK